MKDFAPVKFGTRLEERMAHSLGLTVNILQAVVLQVPGVYFYAVAVVECLLGLVNVACSAWLLESIFLNAIDFK